MRGDWLDRCEELARRIREHFPEVPARRVEELPHTGWGGDNDALLVDGTLVFLFPRDDEIAAALGVQARLLPELAPRAPVRIPAFRYVAWTEGDSRTSPRPDAAGARPHDGESSAPLFVGYPLIPGAPLTPERFRAVARDGETRERIATELGGFLSALHAFPLDRAAALGLAPPEHGIREQVERGRATLRERVYPEVGTEERRWLEALHDAWLGDPRHFLQPPAVCHGDLTSDHILLAPDRRGVSGIIDFTDMCTGDPAGDWVWALEYGEPFLRRALGHYGVPLADLEAFIRVVGFRSRLMTASQLGYGIEIGSQADIDEGRRVLQAAARGDEQRGVDSGRQGG